MPDLLARTTLQAIPSAMSRIGELAGAATAVAADTATTARGDAGAPHVVVKAAPAATARYEPLALLGEGGMGRVERVRDTDLLRDVAVKHLLPELRHDAAMVAQFLWEARVTAHLDHPNIVPVHDLGVTAEGHLFFTMKLVRGRTLEDTIAGARERPDAFPLERRLRVFLQLCNAVAFAHARGVLHRDLKPANVMIGDFGETLVSDWGVALPLPGEAGDALRPLVPGGVATTTAGTPMYMSPEQARGEELDLRSDVYTLGVILYELVALQPAFGEPSVPAVLAKVLAGDAPPLASVRPETPRNVAAVVAKAMALARDARYADATALAADVEIVLDGRTPTAEDASLVRRAARYYVAHDPGMARLRVVDIDLWMAASMLIGVGIGALVVAWIGHAAWLVLAIGLAVGVPPTRRWWRLRTERPA